MKDGQTIGQWLNWDFEKNGDLEIRNKNGQIIYWERSSLGWGKYKYDSQGNAIHFEDSHGAWRKWEHDSQGKLIYYENSDGYIEDNRIPQTITYEGRKYQLIP